MNSHEQTRGPFIVVAPHNLVTSWADNESVPPRSMTDLVLRQVLDEGVAVGVTSSAGVSGDEIEYSRVYTDGDESPMVVGDRATLGTSSFPGAVFLDRTNGPSDSTMSRALDGVEKRGADFVTPRVLRETLPGELFGSLYRDPEHTYGVPEAALGVVNDNDEDVFNRAIRNENAAVRVFVARNRGEEGAVQVSAALVCREPSKKNPSYAFVSIHDDNLMLAIDVANNLITESLSDQSAGYVGAIDFACDTETNEWRVVNAAFKQPTDPSESKHPNQRRHWAEAISGVALSILNIQRA